MLVSGDPPLLLVHRWVTAQAKAYRMEKSGRGTSMVIDSMMTRVTELPLNEVRHVSVA